MSEQAQATIPATSERPYGVIYKITCAVNGKIYVGKTMRSRPTRRWSEHKDCALRHANNPRGQAYFYNALRMHGIENFAFEVIDHADSEPLLLAKEMYWIAALGSTRRNIGYNSTYGGESGVPTPETLAKQIGRPCRTETREKIRAAQKGKPREHSEAFYAAMAARKDRPLTPAEAAYRERMKTNPIGRGTKRTEEQRRRMGDGIRKAYASPELRAKVSAIHKASHAENPRPGHRLNEEQRKRLSESTKRRYANMSDEARKELSIQCSARNKGRKPSPETVTRRAATNRAKWTPDKRAAWAERMRTSDVVKNITKSRRSVKEAA